jgi:hypothetical protein
MFFNNFNILNYISTSLIIMLSSFFNYLIALNPKSTPTFGHTAYPNNFCIVKCRSMAVGRWESPIALRRARIWHAPRNRWFFNILLILINVLIVLNHFLLFSIYFLLFYWSTDHFVAIHSSSLKTGREYHYIFKAQIATSKEESSIICCILSMPRVTKYFKSFFWLSSVNRIFMWNFVCQNPITLIIFHYFMSK